MDINLSEEIKKIRGKCLCVGPASAEVLFARDMVTGKNKSNQYFICEGLWAVEKIIEKNIEVEAFFLCEDALGENANQTEIEKIAKLLNFSLKNYIISVKSCQKISDRDGFDRFFIICRQPKYELADFKKFNQKTNGALAIVLDSLEQPGNVGAILRSFDAAGGDFAIMVNPKAKLSSSRLTRASLGASFMLPCLETDLESAQKFLSDNGYKIVLTDLSATKSYKEVDYGGKIAIVVGNEHSGVSASWREMDRLERVIIPMLGSVESLNVGFASTLVAYEAGLYKNRK